LSLNQNLDAKLKDKDQELSECLNLNEKKKLKKFDTLSYLLKQLQKVIEGDNRKMKKLLAKKQAERRVGSEGTSVSQPLRGSRSSLQSKKRRE